MEGIRVTAHPLDTPLILDCIFKKLGVSDLKTCRQVNRLWHEAATVSMRPAVAVKFGLKACKLGEDRRPDFLNVVQSRISTFTTLPFANNFELYDIRIDHPEFWAFCGSSIKSLRLHGNLHDSADVFRRLVFQSCPNLESLVLSYVVVAGCVDDDEETLEPSVWVQPRFPQNINLKRLEFSGSFQLGGMSFLELLSYFPSLEELDLAWGEDSSRVFRSVATCREHDPQCWNIKRIAFDIKCLKEPESDLQFLLDDNLSLETLEVRRVEKTEHVRALRNILSANATTLKSLKLYGQNTAELFDSPYDTMLEKLEDLSLDRARIASLNFLRYLPNLKKLELLKCIFAFKSESEENLDLLNHWVASDCTEFTLDLRESDGNAGWEENLLLLFRRIPNVQKLSVFCCKNEVFAGICEIFQNLVCLELLDSEVDDCGISGLDKKDVKRINKKGRSCRELRGPLSEQRLSSLKTLKWFHYEANGVRVNPLGFCAALCGVLQLPQLQHLKVENCANAIWDLMHEQFSWRDP